MSHQDQNGHTASSSHHQALKQALDWLLAPAVLSNLTFRNDCTWTPRSLIFTALLWVWSDETALTDRFFTARKIVVWMLDLTQKPASTNHLHVGERPPGPESSPCYHPLSPPDIPQHRSRLRTFLL